MDINSILIFVFVSYVSYSIGYYRAITVTVHNLMRNSEEDLRNFTEAVQELQEKADQERNKKAEDSINE